MAMGIDYGDELVIDSHSDFHLRRLAGEPAQQSLPLLRRAVEKGCAIEGSRTQQIEIGSSEKVLVGVGVRDALVLVHNGRLQAGLALQGCQAE